MAERIDFVALAKELGVHSNDLVAHAIKINLGPYRKAAKLTPGQANKLRQDVRGGAVKPRAVRQREAAPPPPPPPREPRIKWTHCMCCDLDFDHSEDEIRRMCRPCESHYRIDDESPERAIARHSHHEQRLRQLYNDAHDLLGQKHQQMKAALRTRDTWQRVLVDVVMAHEEQDDGTCCCGDAYPCVTRRVLESSKPGHRPPGRGAGRAQRGRVGGVPRR